MIGRLVALSSSAALFASVSSPVTAQSMSGMDMSGMAMPAKKKPAARRAPAKPTPKKPGAKKAAKPARPKPAGVVPPASGSAMQDMPGMDHSAMPGMDMPQGSTATTPGAAMPDMDHGAMPGMDMHGAHAGHDMAAMPGMAMTGTALPAGNAPAPAPPMDHYADRQFAPAEMERSRMAMMREQGAQTFTQVMFNLAEYQVRQGKDGYRWDGEAWFGGDIDRLWLKTEGEGEIRDGLDSAEVQALYSHAIDPYFNLQTGIRQDFKPKPSRTYATIGFEGLAPYLFEVEETAFLSDKGDVLGRLEGYYDQRITQRLILQARAELNLAAQDVPENRIGSGVTDAELGLRLRYEIAREFAPYVGVSYEAKTGRTADYARADGRDPTSTSFVAGVRFWF